MFLFEKVNNALALASDWFKANKLTLHPSKTKYIFFSAGQHTELNSEILTLDGVVIEQIGLNCETKWFKFLGMRLDDKLSWEGQRAHVYQKASAGTFMLARLKRNCAAQNQIDDFTTASSDHTLSIVLKCGDAQKASDLKVFFQITEYVCSPHFRGLAIGPTQIHFFASNKI